MFRYWFFRSWGRIGTTIGGSKIERCYDNKEKATANFEHYFHQHTGNRFGEEFVKQPGKYCPIDIEYATSNEENYFQECTVESKLPDQIKDLVRLLFDVNEMKKQLMAFELDTEKMPLGKLSRKQIETAYGVLTQLSNLITEGGERSSFIGLSNQFYTLIPHSYGLQLPPVLDTVEMIKNKTEMMDSLLEIEIAYTMLNAKIDESTNPLDARYAQLNTELEVLDQTSDEFKRLQEYVTKTHGQTHTSYNLKIMEVFKVKRAGEEKRYKPFKTLHNRKLLWHGSRLTNFVGILSHGLKIAPPEAPVNGYMFGKGIYFADMVSKSANYCCSYGNTNALMLLCEVALGDMYPCMSANYIEKLPPGKHSTLGVGSTYPNAEESYFRPDGVEIPSGTPKQNYNGASLCYNEYIVYDVAQVNIQYLLRMDFRYNNPY